MVREAAKTHTVSGPVGDAPHGDDGRLKVKLSR